LKENYKLSFFELHIKYSQMIRRCLSPRLLKIFVCVCALLLIAAQFLLQSTTRSTSYEVNPLLAHTKHKKQSRGLVEAYNMSAIRNAPLIFIGGYEHSGPGLLASLLDLHDNIRCTLREPGTGTRALFEMLKLNTRLTEGSNRQSMLEDAGLNQTKVFRFNIFLKLRLKRT
jgi:hypothetical protein